MIPGVVAGAKVGSFQVWTPGDLATPPKLWLDDESPITVVSGACSQWNDRSGNGLNFSQGNAGARPAVVIGAGGRRALRFDGTNDGLVGGAGAAREIFRNVGVGWALAIYSHVEDSTPSWRTIYRSYRGTSPYLERFNILSGRAGNASYVNRPYIGARRLDSESLASVTMGGAYIGGHMMLGVARWGDAAVDLHIDGQLEATSAASFSPGVTSNTAAGAPDTIGYDSASGGNFFRGDLSALIVGSGSLPSSDEIDKLFGWAAHRYGLTDNLPPGHPYKSSPP